MRRNIIRIVLFAILVIFSVAVSSPYLTRWSVDRGGWGEAIVTTDLDYVVIGDVIYMRVADEAHTYEIFPLVLSLITLLAVVYGLWLWYDIRRVRDKKRETAIFVHNAPHMHFT